MTSVSEVVGATGEVLFAVGHGEFGEGARPMRMELLFP